MSNAFVENIKSLIDASVSVHGPSQDAALERYISPFAVHLLNALIDQVAQLTKERDEARDEVERAKAEWYKPELIQACDWALAQLRKLLDKCPSCGGKGSEPHPWDSGDVTCETCEGIGVVRLIDGTAIVEAERARILTLCAEEADKARETLGEKIHLTFAIDRDVRAVATLLVIEILKARIRGDE